MKRIWISVLVWLAYLTADSVATVALGTLARSQGNLEDNSLESNNVLKAFWAPFLLLHLGGPDTITAYSLEDNELWLRHLHGLVVQVGVAFIIFVRYSWDNNTTFRFLTIPVFITGVIKYGERTFVLRSSSAKQFKDSLRSSPPKTGRGEKLHHKESTTVVAVSNDEGTSPKDYYLVEANMLFKRLRCLFADLLLDHNDRKESYSFIHSKSATHAFKLVAVELGLMYDLLYTKANMIYSRFGIFLRCFCFFSNVSVSVVFLFFIDKHAYSSIDISITYVLLLGAVFLEVYAFIMLLFSDWTKVWLTKRIFTSGGNLVSNVLLSTNSRRWSESMGQYNFLSLCVEEISSKPIRVPKLFGIKEILEKFHYLTWEDVNIDLQEMIFKKIMENSKKIEGDHFNIKRCKKLLAQRGDNALANRGRIFPFPFSFLDNFRWCTIDVDFDHSLLVWHIATDICYHVDYGDNGDDDNGIPVNCKMSKRLSDYMLYLLVMCPNMLPKGIGEIRYKETCAEALRFFEKEMKKQNMSNISKNEACGMLLNVRDKPGSLSVLYSGSRLAKQLQELKSGYYVGRKEEVWKMISEVWTEMLTYAANSCGWKEHGKQLIKGGELLTHICVLMAHLGLSEQYQQQNVIDPSQGSNRPKDFFLEKSSKAEKELGFGQQYLLPEQDQGFGDRHFQHEKNLSTSRLFGSR
ncbi:uncharacterized protein LOC116121780 [Pistacia vera]|uniref:uncharacterized protein LOC116121780 n=1 Tax=Pistacia vera TaxID=55513 RepID=UPI0012630216|nr:uncharacterized protein LOC116121780 [Pistacia vera]